MSKVSGVHSPVVPAVIVVVVVAAVAIDAYTTVHTCASLPQEKLILRHAWLIL